MTFETEFASLDVLTRDPVRSPTPPGGNEDETLESSAVGLSRLGPSSGTRCVALCGRRGIRTAVPALARGRTSLQGSTRDHHARSQVARDLSEPPVRAGRYSHPHLAT